MHAGKLSGCEGAGETDEADTTAKKMFCSKLIRDTMRAVRAITAVTLVVAITCACCVCSAA